MPCSLAWRTLTLRRTKPSARSARTPTSFAVPTPLGPPSPLDASPASMITSSALTPEPSICRLQRMHGPRSGIPWRFSRGGIGGGGAPGLSADHRDQVLVVGAVVLVGVGERRAGQPGPVAIGAVLVARLVVGRLRAR